MKELIIPSNLIEIKKQKISPNYKILNSYKLNELFTEEKNKYILEFKKTERKLNSALINSNFFRVLNVYGEILIRNKQIKNLFIDIESSKSIFDEQENNDWIIAKKLTIEGENVSIYLNSAQKEKSSINDDEDEYIEDASVVNTVREAMPLQELEISAKVIHAKIKNQKIKKIIFKAEKEAPHTICLENLPYLEYLDISCFKKLDCYRNDFWNLKTTAKLDKINKQIYLPLENNWTCTKFIEQFEFLNDMMDNYVNYFNIFAINPNCIVKISSDTGIQYSSYDSTNWSSLGNSIYIKSKSSDYNITSGIPISAIIDFKNSQTIEIKWAVLQSKILLYSYNNELQSLKARISMLEDQQKKSNE